IDFVTNLAFFQKTLLALVSVGKELLHAGDQLGFRDYTVLVAVQRFHERLGEETPRTKTTKSLGPFGPLAEAARSSLSPHATLLEDHTGRLAFLIVQPAIAVLVEHFHQLPFLTHHHHGPETAGSLGTKWALGVLGVRVVQREHRHQHQDEHADRFFHCNP